MDAGSEAGGAEDKQGSDIIILIDVSGRGFLARDETGPNIDISRRFAYFLRGVRTLLVEIPCLRGFQAFGLLSSPTLIERKETVR
jgi:hypothetical protein